MPPLVIYKGKHLYSTWTNDVPDGVLYSVSESGWMEGTNFLCWFKKGFLPAVHELLKTGPMILFSDSHHSHLNLEFIELARKSNVHPSHTSHFLQALDFGVHICST